MKTLKLAIAATGIGALVLVLVEVASAMDLFGDSTEDAEEKQKKLKDQMAKTAEQMKYIAELSNQSVEANDQYTEMLIKQAKLRGASEEEVNKIIKENIEDNLKEREMK
jgi:molecular chaperone GrpE (heat shock protein)